MTDTPITLVGNIVTDPEVRHTPAGAAVANFRIASTPRTYSKTTNQWEDGETLFLTVNVWRDQAQNIADSLTKGTRVIVTGKLKSRSYVTRDGDQRTVFEVEADEVGPSLKFATAQVTKTSGGGGQAAVSSGSWGQQSQQQPVAAGAWGSQDSGAPF